MNQTAVRGAVKPRGGVDSHNPETTEVALLETTIAIRMRQTLFDMVFRNRPDVLA
jgi:hypothetical protein